MSETPHTYGPTCRLAKTVSFSGSKGDDDMPELRAQYFYSSALSIDDPLSVVPTGNSEATKYPPRPFSAYDNDALEEAWVGLASEKDRKNHNRSKSPKSGWKRFTERHNSTAGISIQKNNKRNSPKASPTAAALVIPSRAKDGEIDSQREDSDRFRNMSGASLCPIDPRPEDEQPDSIDPTPDTFLGTSNGNDETDYQTGRKIPGNQVIQRKPEYEGSSPSPHSAHRHHVTFNTQIPTRCSEGVNSPRIENRDYSEGGPTLHDKSENSAYQNQAYPDEGEGEAKKQIARKPLAGHTSLDLDTEGVQGDAASGGYSGKLFHQSSERDTGQSPSTEPSLSELNRRVGNKSENQQLKNRHGFESHSSHASVPEGKSRLLKGNEPGATSLLSDLTNLPAQGGEAGLAGSPFAKLPSHEESSQRTSSTRDGGDQRPLNDGPSNLPESSRGVHERDSTETETVQDLGCKAHKKTNKQAEVPVGISRLHLVKLPALQMVPIYWSPIHELGLVVRGTWFYKDTMYPVEPAVANQLEMGYRELRPWSRTWNDELNSAIEVGALGEEKISYRLWPKEEDQKAPPYNMSEHIISADPYCAARCFHGDAAAEGKIDSDESDKSTSTKTITKKYPNSHVIYKDAENAFILKPNLQPSAYYGRRPLQKIRKGTTVGIHVVRGFNWKAWEKAHPPKKSNNAAKAQEKIPVSGDADAGKRSVCAACRSQEERPQVRNLVLVIHGIGQKLSERIESFHFTHAINSFRRSVNVELGHESVQSVLRDDFGGIMILPVNWRSSLSFEDGGPMREGDEGHAEAHFSLKDITPDTIPAVRNLISDVMLDIPFYMSHHKPKMIQAVIREANRVYRLWCKNNPGFHNEGHVHILAHSLGSAMAVEILSKQPTFVPRADLDERKINPKHFDFDTKNLFLVGSPAGFFLLLEKGNLTPRLGRNKPGADYVDSNDKTLTGSAGTFGCLAVDNIYNVMDYNDPIAYRLNATVDPQFAAGLKNAQVPSATTGFFGSIGNAVKSLTPGLSSPADLVVGQVAKPPAMARLPSQLELEVHDFTREEIAEKKFYLLNDNGQVDWFLSSGGGPLDIQYLNMLGAHSSYWTSQDFIRMLVIELGRKQGKHHTLPNMRAVKAGHRS
ncbi:hypothetical protein M430DRAFT_118339 [Amorphotheca resinae ATCC 22711]|jgi:hypothetical protein|uniref:DDHD domain-containing protein n=1 Tax=Amorphotheca resinae ATCC 22711 TaxID=857342 RepID=A0A2T3B5W2_AMORE|nr:hypothetical protein M430DRAFT_118339 [Amorphotheca resinae ATCC 22711]PSS22142.1 hypothetical protein M430DRAFT_118339 [Amorphotheca resinae ATCC 22711]